MAKGKFPLISTIIDKIVDFFSKKYRVYMYSITINGYIIPPEPNRRKKVSGPVKVVYEIVEEEGKQKLVARGTPTQYLPDTTLQFEISFEITPYFRSIIRPEHFEYWFIKNILDDLIASAEMMAAKNKAFTYYVELPVEKARNLLEFIRDKTITEVKEMKTGTVKVSTIPTFVVKDMSIVFEGSFDVSEKILKRFEAIDTVIVRIFRPDELEPYWEFTFEYLHSLK